jgi:hypothetical protein
VPTPAPAKTADDDDDDDLDADTAAALDKALAETLTSLPPEAQAAYPPAVSAAMKKYGGWSKIPKAQRAKLLKQITGMAKAQANVGAQINGALAGVATPAPPPAKPAAPPGWFVRHAVSPPGFDPKHANLEKFIAYGYAEAAKYVPDAKVWWIDVDGVFTDGHADLTLPSHASTTGSMTMRFISPSRSKPDPSIPRVVPQQLQCAFYIRMAPDGGEMYETGSDCKEHLLPKPRCSAAQVWKRVLAKHPDAAGAVGALIYREIDGKPMWDFDIRDDQSPISERVPDDC